ncbi:MAG: glycoside hydrolase 43 family protein [Clostridia bacterium]|nr:glycoside hydrolase 43 family protein [Clostridia bacterium]
MRYTNPVINADYSDPDVIRVGEDFYMVASSFNYTPCVPVLHSRNLVEWELVNYVSEELPFERFNKVCAGDGAWAPSIRFHGGKFYCVIPFPDEGIYVSETQDPCGKWSPLRPLIVGKGIIDPCPIWTDGKCYLAVAFAKSRAGFNSCIGLYEVSEDLTECLSDGYKIIYDGHDNNPTIEGPKFYKHGDYFYILAPAGSVRSGWQVALRSKSVYGPYESKVILMQNDSPINGPHQGALVDLPDGKWAFVHFQDMRAYGRIVHLQPAVWLSDWPICGEVRDEFLAGTPVEGGEYPVDVRTKYSIPESDNFKCKDLSLIWQTPANKGEGWYSLEGGLRLNCVKCGELLKDVPQVFTTKITRLSFTAEVRLDAHFTSDGDEAGVIVTGEEEYAYVRVCRQNGTDYIQLRFGDADGEERFTNMPSRKKKVVIKVIVENHYHGFDYMFKVNGILLPYAFDGMPGKWVGAKLGLYARNTGQDSEGFAEFKYFKISDVKAKYKIKKKPFKCVCEE